MNSLNPRPTPILARLLLGLFIIWQIVFLFFANILSLLGGVRESWRDQPAVEEAAPAWIRGKDRAAGTEKALTRLTNFWSELTGQPQNWSLFAPSVTSVIPFVAVECCWEDDPSSVRSIARWLAPLAGRTGFDESALAAAAWRTEPNRVGVVSNGDVPPPSPVPWRHKSESAVVLLSANEPSDPRRFVKFGHFRLRRYESSIDVSLASPDKEPDTVVDEWRETIEDRVRDRGRLIEAYLRWQLRRFAQEHPELPVPKQVILWVRLYRVPPPDQMPSPWDWEGPEWHPVARWQPEAEWIPGHLPVEMFNPVIGRFESLRERHESPSE
jgi:hypothetical protein